MNPIIGRTLNNRYRVVDSIGRGGMAEVYKVWDEERATYLALKLLREDLAQDRIFLRRFKREAKTLAKLQHPNIVRFYGMEQDSRLAFMLMDFVEGENLKVEIFDLDGAPMTAERVIEIMRPVCSALHYAHGQGMVHCDVKPSNIMIKHSGEVLLADFGVARMTDAATATMVGMGTPAYMAPELVRGDDPTPQTDIYSLGVILFEMLTGGERPFTGERAETTGSTSEKVRWEQMHLEPPSLRNWNLDAPSELEAVLRRCLEKDPAKRYGSTIELLNAMDDAVGEEGPTRIEEPVKVVPENELVLAAEHLMAEPALKPGQKEARAPEPSEKKRLPKWVWMVGVGSIALLVLAGLGSFGGQSTRGVSEERARQTAVAFGLQATQSVAETATAGLTSTVAPTVTATATITTTSIPTPTIPPGATIVSESDGMVQVHVPAGEFWMGSSLNDIGSHRRIWWDANGSYTETSWFEDEEPQHKVYLDAYWFDQTEVTNGMYARCVNAGICDLPSKITSYTRSIYYGDDAYVSYPVIYVSWHDAQAYCEWAGRRLPTEAEWEKAARGVDGRKYPWGDDLPSCSIVNYEPCDRDTDYVGSYPDAASPYGALDMSGNVYEWVDDWYDEEYYDRSPLSNPQGPTNGDTKVTRGCSWLCYGIYLHAAIRGDAAPDKHGFTRGFRCAQDPVP
jgi:serine/threonine-protein kinase